MDTKAAELFSRSLEAFGQTTAKVAAIAPKVAALQFCDSMRARTKAAPKFARPKEYAIVRQGFSGMKMVGNKMIPTPSPYVTYKGGRPLSIYLRRYEITRRIGTEKVNKFIAYSYAHLKHDRRGKIVPDLAAERAELKKIHLRIARSGLAKMSWNWIKGKIRGGNGISYSKRKRDRRNPTESVDGNYTGSSTKTGGYGYAEVKNHLDYILSAVKQDAVTEALRAASAKLAWKRGVLEGMSSKQAAKYARELLDSLTSQASA